MVSIKIRVDESGEISIPEKLIHDEIEKSLEMIDPGLVFIEHKPRIGTGEIDTLAVDADNRPVFIEYKAPGDFDKDALIQVMDYLSFFLRDEAHFTMLRDYILNRKPELGRIDTEIRLICVVNSVEERVKNACFSVTAPVSIFSYSIFKENENTYNVVLRKELDTEDERVSIPTQTLGKKEMLDEYPSLRPIYEEVEKYTKSLGGDIHENPLGDHEVQFRKRKIFMVARFRKRKGLMLDMGSGEELQNPRFRHWQSNPFWGYVHLSAIEEFNDEVKQWIKKAYEKSA